MPEGDRDRIRKLAERAEKARPELTGTVEALLREGAGCEAKLWQFQDRLEMYNLFDGFTPNPRAMEKLIEMHPDYVKSEEAEDPGATSPAPEYCVRSGLLQVPSG